MAKIKKLEEKELEAERDLRQNLNIATALLVIGFVVSWFSCFIGIIMFIVAFKNALEVGKNTKIKEMKSVSRLLKVACVIGIIVGVVCWIAIKMNSYSN